MVKRGSSYLDHSPNSAAAKSLESAVKTALAPLQTWNDRKLPRDIVSFRDKLRLRTLLCTSRFTGAPAKYLPTEIIRKIILLIEENGGFFRYPVTDHSVCGTLVRG